jgi:hypothetical protein
MHVFSSFLSCFIYVCEVFCVLPKSYIRQLRYSCRLRAVPPFRGFRFPGMRKERRAADNTSRNEIRVAHTTQNCHWSKSSLGNGRVSRVEGHRSRVEGHRSRVEGHRSRVEGHRSRVEGHRSRVEGYRSRVIGRGSKVEVEGQKSRSRVKSRGRGSKVEGRSSRVENGKY